MKIESVRPSALFPIDANLVIEWIGVHPDSARPTRCKFVFNGHSHTMKFCTDDGEIDWVFEEGEGIVGQRSLNGRRRSSPATLEDGYVSQYEFVSVYENAEAAIEIFLTDGGFRYFWDHWLESLKIKRNYFDTRLLEPWLVDHGEYIRVDFTSHDIGNQFASFVPAKRRPPLKALVFRSLAS